MFFLIQSLQDSLGIRVPALFEYTSTRMAFAALTAFLVTLFCGKPFIKKLYAWKVGDRVRSQHCPLLSELHRNKNDTPTMGGILILCAVLISLFLWMDLKASFTLILLLTTVGVGLLGAWDDYAKLRLKNTGGISGKKKLAIQVALSGIVALYLLWEPFTERIHQGSWFAPPIAKSAVESLSVQSYTAQLYLPFLKEPFLQFTGVGLFLMGFFLIFVITGSSNAVNLTDGLDGLAAGTILLAASALASIAFISSNVEWARYLNILYIENSTEIAVYLAAVVGACLGFLWYNSHPAQLFMGDTGSLALGAILGVSAVLLKREFLYALIGGVFVIETLSVMLQVSSFRLRNKKRIFLCTPLHHHFEYKGLPETKVVTRFWIIGLICALLGVASLKFQ